MHKKTPIRTIEAVVKSNYCHHVPKLFAYISLNYRNISSKTTSLFDLFLFIKLPVELITTPLLCTRIKF